MTPARAPLTIELAQEVKQILEQFVEAAQHTFGTHLHSIVLFGSAAEGRLRATSDVNVVLVLESFERAQADQLRDALRIAQAAIQLRPMFLLRSELEEAGRVFAQKFADILRRRQVLYGPDPFNGVAVSREAKVSQLRQQLLNLLLRLRALYVSQSLREEQLALVIAEVAGPLRSCAAALCELEDRAAASPKLALEQVAASLGDSDWEEILSLISQAREQRRLPVGAGARGLFRLMELARAMQARALKLS